MQLYINTSQKNQIKVAVKQGNKILIENNIIVEYNQSEKLLPTIDKMLKLKKINLKKIKKIIVSNQGDYAGFTALRIGIATANALGYALGIPVQSDKNNKTINKNKKFDVITPIYSKEPNITLSLAK